MARRWTLASGVLAQRIDRWLALELGIGRAAAKALVDDGAVRVNGVIVRKSFLVGDGDSVEVLREPTRPDWTPVPEPQADLRVIRETPAFLVVDKPPGQPSIPTFPEETGTLCNALLGHFPELAGVGYRPQEPGLLHRLDNGTSGLMLVARSGGAFDSLRTSLQEGRWEKHYVALVRGSPSCGTFRGFVGKTKGHRSRVAFREAPASGLERAVALTVLSVTPHGPEWSRVELSCGRAARHQLRVQLAAMGHPLAGDTLYGGSSPAGVDLAHHFLHASRLVFPLQEGDETMAVEAPLPQLFRHVLDAVDRPRAGDVGRPER